MLATLILIGTPGDFVAVVFVIVVSIEVVSAIVVSVIIFVVVVFISTVLVVVQKEQVNMWCYYAILFKLPSF